MPPLRILKYLDSTPRGGAEIQALDICRNAARYGLEITLATGHRGPLDDEFISTGIRFVPLERRAPIDLFLVSHLRRLIREYEIDIVHGYQPVDGIHLYLAARRMQSVRRVLSFQGFIQDRRNRIAASFLAPRMDANIVVSDWLRDWIEVERGIRFGRNTFTILNSADPARLVPKGNSILQELGVPEPTRFVGMVGNFYKDPRKDQLTICKALPRVFERFPNVHCLFAGRVEPGAEDKMAECLSVVIDAGIADRVHFLGGRSDIPDILAVLEVFIFSSLHEGLPIAAAEAMVAGVPMLVSDIGPLMEATGGGRYARVFPAGNAEALADELIELLRDDEGRRRMATEAKRFADAELSIDAHIRALSQLYESLTCRSPDNNGADNGI
ncbi:MAG: glycosyltransferase family 4 protein [Acidobacteria bacterium]|nr:glycosyltransferase family 4 protein [Acidobacteriota bacterium]MCW5948013.1 glycosyltransferase family 4 protein [Pyrinomonadaceae bacterium]